MCKDVTIQLLRPDLPQMVTLQRVLECAPGYAERVNGAPPGAADAQSMFTALPGEKTYEDKFVFGIFTGKEMVGCIDLIRGYPTANAATLGLLLVAEQHQGMGIGRRGREPVPAAVSRSSWSCLQFGAYLSAASYLASASFVCRCFRSTSPQALIGSAQWGPR